MDTPLFWFCFLTGTVIFLTVNDYLGEKAYRRQEEKEKRERESGKKYGRKPTKKKKEDKPWKK